MGVKFAMEDGTAPPCQISPPPMQCVAPAERKPQNRPLSNLNNRRFAVRAMCRLTLFIA